MVEIERVGSEVAQLGECPVWSVPEQALYWVDIDGRAVHRYDPADDTTASRALDGRPGSLVLTSTAGRLIVAAENELVELDWDTGSTSSYAVVEAPETGNRMNDGRCDPVGRFIVGTMWPDTKELRSTGSLYQIESPEKVRVLETEVGVPNGLVFDEDRGLMYWADSFLGTIWAWDYDLDSGERSNKRVFFDYGAHDDVPGKPDGGCLDADGCYWSASVHGWAVIRVTPTGEVDRRIELPVKKPTMPAFGGPDLSTMYVTSIGDDGSSSVEIPAGSLLEIDPGVQGLPEPFFAAR